MHHVGDDSVSHSINICRLQNLAHDYNVLGEFHDLVQMFCYRLGQNSSGAGPVPSSKDQ